MRIATINWSAAAGSRINCDTLPQVGGCIKILCWLTSDMTYISQSFAEARARCRMESQAVLSLMLTLLTVILSGQNNNSKSEYTTIVYIVS